MIIFWLWIVATVVIAVGGSWWIWRSCLKRAKSANLQLSKNLLARIELLESKKTKWEAFLEGLKRNCAEVLWRKLADSFANADLDSVKTTLAGIDVANDNSCFSQDKLRKKIIDLNCVVDGMEEIFYDIEDLPRTIVVSRKNTQKNILDAHELVAETELLMNTTKGITNKLQKRAEDKKSVFLKKLMEIDGLIKVDWIKYENVFSMLVTELKQVRDAIKTEQKRNNRYLEIWREMPKRIEDWKNTKEDGENEINNLMQGVMDSYHLANLILNNNENYEILIAEDVVNNLLFKADDLCDRAEILFEIKKLGE